MRIITDLHLHSRFSRAVSKDMNLPTLAVWADKKGIGLVGTGDFTHPIWYREIFAQLREVNPGIFKLKNGEEKVFFLLSTELSCIYSQGGRTRRIHLLILAPNLSAVEEINKALIQRRVNLLSDGRPILGMSARDLTGLILEADENCLVIPAHAWTPWFSLYGSMSGFDSIAECFGDMAKYVTAIETGLSSDPAMNWRIEELSNRKIISFGDAHSPAKLGREATVFQIKNSKLKISYKDIYDALTGKPDGGLEIAYTIEFYPEEGKYHYTGHRNCGVVYSPKQTRKLGTTCPVCGKSLTVGVASRVEHLADREVEVETEKDNFGVRWNKEKEGNHATYVMLVPLLEIIAEAVDSTPSSKKVLGIYDLLTASFGGEFNVLLETNPNEVERISGKSVAEAIVKVRNGDIHIEPGYDGVFGKVSIWPEETKLTEDKQDIDQARLF